jgi:hypothetical protein
MTALIEELRSLVYSLIEDCYTPGETSPHVVRSILAGLSAAEVTRLAHALVGQDGPFEVVDWIPPQIARMAELLEDVESVRRWHARITRGGPVDPESSV